MNRRTTRPTVGFDPMFVAFRAPRRPPETPDSWDGLRHLVRNEVGIQGRWEGSLQAVLAAILKGGTAGHARALEAAKQHGWRTPRERLEAWLRHCRMDWTLDEEQDRLVLLKRQPKATTKARAIPSKTQDGEEVGLFLVESSTQRLDEVGAVFPNISDGE